MALGSLAVSAIVANAHTSGGAMLTADILARHGGDEFVLLLPATSPQEAGGVLERLRSGELPVSWSIGASEWLPGESLEAGLARADRDLYIVKQSLRGSGGRAAGYRARSLLPPT
jgi:GGDEF domain-containing protein